MARRQSLIPIRDAKIVFPPAIFHGALGAILAIGTHAAFAAGTEMIVNGSFESPAFDAAGAYASAGDGWIKSVQGPVSIIRGNIRDGSGQHYGRTPFGRQYLGLDPRSPNGFYALESQIIPGFVAGRGYCITILAADADGGKAPVLEVSLNDGGGKVYFSRNFDLPVGGPYIDRIRFTKLTAAFRAPVTGDITLTMKNAGVNFPVDLDPGSISIDKVSVVPIADEDFDTEGSAD